MYMNKKLDIIFCFFRGQLESESVLIEKLAYAESEDSLFFK